MNDNILIIENNYSWLVTDNKEFKDKLWKALRFRDKNYFFNSAYRHGYYDGFSEHFVLTEIKINTESGVVKRKAGRFKTGILLNIMAALDAFKLEYKIEDHRKPIKFLVDKIDENYLGYPKLRDYQVDYVNKIIAPNNLNWHRASISAPTGSGKSLVITAIAKASQGIPMLILVNKKSLVLQIYDDLKKYGINDVGVFYGDVKEDNKTTIVSTIQSATLMGDEKLRSFEILIVDEAHEMLSKTCIDLYKNKLKNTVCRISLSATLFAENDKNQKQNMLGWFGPVTKVSCAENGQLKAKDLQERNILSQAECSFIHIDEPKILYDVYTDAVTKGIAENYYLHEKTVELVNQLEGRILILVHRVNHGDLLKEICPDWLWVRGIDNVETRREVIQKLKYEKNKVVAIATTGIFGVGVSFEINCLINSAGGKSFTQLIQRFGRGLRVAEDKDNLQYFDFMFTNNSYLETHSKKRIKTLKGEGYDVQVYKSVEEWKNRKQ